MRFLPRAGRDDGSEGFDGPLALELKKLGSDQLQPFEAHMIGLADDVVVVHGYAERPCHLNDRLRHLVRRKHNIVTFQVSFDHVCDLFVYCCHCHCCRCYLLLGCLHNPRLDQDGMAQAYSCQGNLFFDLRPDTHRLNSASVLTLL